MKVLVLGGTGAMGTHLVDLLISDGFEVAVTSRTRNGTNDTLRYIQGNAQDDVFIKNVLREKWDIIVDFMVYSTVNFQRRVKLLLSATSQYVFLSSARVYADSPTLITEESLRLLDVSEDQTFLSTDEYALSKARQENVLMKSDKKNWTIIRPYITYNEDRLQLGVLEKEDWLYRALHGRTIIFSEDINSKATTLTFGLDVAKGIRSILGNNSAAGEVFHITTSQSVLWKEVLAMYMDTLERHLGYRPKLLLQNLNGFCEWHPAKYQVMYDRMFDRRFDNQKINGYINTSEFSDALTGLKKCLESFLDKPKFRDINWHAEVMRDKIANEYTPLSEMPTLKKKLKYWVFRNILF